MNGSLKLSSLVKPHYPLMAILYVFSLALAAVTALLSLVAGPVISWLTGGKNSHTATGKNSEFLELWDSLGLDLTWVTGDIGASLIVLAAIKFFLYLTVFIGWEATAEKIAKTLRGHFVERFLALRPEASTDTKTAEHIRSFTTVATTEMHTLKYYIVRAFGGIPREAVQSIMLTALLFYLSPYLTLVFVGCALPTAFILRRLSKKIKKRARSAFDFQNQLAEWIRSRLSGFETIKHYKSESYETAKMSHLTNFLLEKQFYTAKTASRAGPISEGLTAVALAVVFTLASYLAGSTSIEPEILISFFATLGFLSQSVGKLSKYTNILSTGSASLQKMQEISRNFEALKQNAEKMTWDPATASKTAISLENVSFAYKGNRIDANGVKATEAEATGAEATGAEATSSRQSGASSTQAVFSGFSYEFKYGLSYAVKGPSGAGKSTLISLILRNLTPGSGAIRFFHSEDFRDGICYLPQKITMAGLRISEIISYPDAPGFTERLERAVELSSFDKVMKQKGLTFDSEIGYGDSGLSGGQWQRLHLSRAFYSEAGIIIIDEGSSALDSEVESYIIEGLKKLAQSGKCVISISHRPNMIASVDQVIALK